MIVRAKVQLLSYLNFSICFICFSIRSNIMKQTEKQRTREEKQHKKVWIDAKLGISDKKMVPSPVHPF